MGSVATVVSVVGEGGEGGGGGRGGGGEGGGGGGGGKGQTQDSILSYHPYVQGPARCATSAPEQGLTVPCNN